MPSWRGTSRLGTADHSRGHVTDQQEQASPSPSLALPAQATGWRSSYLREVSRGRRRHRRRSSTAALPGRSATEYTEFPQFPEQDDDDDDDDNHRRRRRSPSPSPPPSLSPSPARTVILHRRSREPLLQRGRSSSNNNNNNNNNSHRRRSRSRSPPLHRRRLSRARTVVDAYGPAAREQDEEYNSYADDEHLMAVNIAAFSSMDLGMAGGGVRSGASTPGSLASAQLNGVGAMGPGGGAASAAVVGGPGAGGPGPGQNYMTPLPAGHQQDLNYLYEKIQELSKLLASNRDKVRELTKKAEEAGRRALANGSHANNAVDGEGGSVQTDAERIVELERELKQRDQLIEAYKHEQRENTGLIGLYEKTVGTMTEQIRNYCLGIEQRFLDQQRHYNNLLQLEKDDHLKSRLERDEYFAHTLKLSGQIRHANRLRTDEWCDEFRVIAALQTQVRCLRRVAGWDPEKPEDEAGWEYLRDCPLNDTGLREGV